MGPLPSCGRLDPRPACSGKAAATQQRLAFRFSCRILGQNDWEHIQPQQGGIHCKIPIVSCLMQPQNGSPLRVCSALMKRRKTQAPPSPEEKEQHQGRAASRERETTAAGGFAREPAFPELVSLWHAKGSSREPQRLKQWEKPLRFISFPSVCVCLCLSVCAPLSQCSLLEAAWTSLGSYLAKFFRSSLPLPPI